MVEYCTLFEMLFNFLMRFDGGGRSERLRDKS